MAISSPLGISPVSLMIPSFTRMLGLCKPIYLAPDSLNLFLSACGMTTVLLTRSWGINSSFNDRAVFHSLLSAENIFQLLGRCLQCVPFTHH